MVSMLSPHHRVSKSSIVHRLAAIAIVSVLAAGCAATGALSRGRDAERRQDYDMAVVEYAKAVRLRPNDTDVRLSLEAGERELCVIRMHGALEEYLAVFEVRGDIEVPLLQAKEFLDG